MLFALSDKKQATVTYYATYIMQHKSSVITIFDNHTELNCNQFNECMYMYSYFSKETGNSYQIVK